MSRKIIRRPPALKALTRKAKLEAKREQEAKDREEAQRRYEEWKKTQPELRHTLPKMKPGMVALMIATALGAATQPRRFDDDP